MKPYLADADVTIYNGDALETLRQLPSESVHMACTSPPFYGLRDYGTGGRVNIHPQEFVSVRDFSRSTGTYLDDLVAGRRAKYVVMHRNEPRAVVVNVETFERLCNAEARLLRDHPQRVSTGGSGEGE